MKVNPILSADWSTSPAKRRMAAASRAGAGTYLAGAPGPVGPVSTLLDRISQQHGTDTGILLGLDHPIGVPLAWARQAGVTAVGPLLGQLGSGDWARFYDVSNAPSLRQPFYPLPSQVKGATSRGRLAEALGVASITELLRQCEQKTPTRKAVGGGGRPGRDRHRLRHRGRLRRLHGAARDAAGGAGPPAGRGADRSGGAGGGGVDIGAGGR